ncbi:MAG TPA: histidine kinase [Chitinophagaceae bacterium]|nr:histidine kinase [Chitinophagaceae bacterium]
MEQSPFIFSNAPKYRIARHLAFWAVWWIFQGFLYSFVGLNNTDRYPIRLLEAMLEAFIFLIPHMFLSYSLMYLVIPRFLIKQKYWQALAGVVVACLLTTLISSTLAITVIASLRKTVAGNRYEGTIDGIRFGFHYSLMAGLRGAITIGGMAAAIKLMKYWYLKEQRNLQLQKENYEGKLQLLKAQIHPHFLFNTLNNIYSHTQDTSPVASRLVSGLSDLLRFILYECNQPLVPLSKELKMIEDYTSLERIRYGSELELHTDLPAKTRDLYIAPLLLLPLIENCFKHGTSKVLDQPWISLHIDIRDKQMQMKLLNGKPNEGKSGEPGNGIGINNVRKRLELIYPGTHELTITNTEEVFIVSLKIELERKTEPLKMPAILEEVSHA